ncbi:unnamed protein product [Heterobilharzia americana]|nr:unnamed protein product [Heterobilharzia americana]
MYKVIWRQFSELICGIENETNGQAKIISWHGDNDHDNAAAADDEFQFRLKISPNKGPYAHAEYEFEVSIRLESFGERPAVRCMSHIYHPNIQDYDCDGTVCLNLFDKWNIEMGLKAIVDGLLFLFYEPNENDPINEHFIIPPGYTFEQAVIESLQGGSYSHYSGPPNKPWCTWYDKQLKDKQNLIENQKVRDQQLEHSRQNYND